MIDISRFDLNLLVVFDAMLQERNVTRAGARIGLSQPSMSNALTRLRKACGDPLFVRTPAGMEPTPLALQLAVPIQAGLGMLKEGLEQPYGFDPVDSGRTFRLLMSDVAEVMVLPLLMRRLKQVAPRIRICVLPLPREAYANALETDHADLAIGNLSFLNTGFYQQRLFEDDYVCLARKSHPALKKTLSLQQYVAAEHIEVPSSRGDAMVERELTKLGLRRNIALQVPSFLSAPIIAMNSDLLLTAPSTAIRMQKNAAQFSVFPLPFAIPKANVRQFWHLRYHHDAGNQWLRAELAGLHHGGEA